MGTENENQDNGQGGEGQGGEGQGQDTGQNQNEQIQGGEGVTKLNIDLDDKGGEGDGQGQGEGNDQDKGAKPWELPYKDGTVIVPEGMRNEDGTPDVAAMAHAMDGLRRKLGAGEFNDPVPEEGESYNLEVAEDLAEQGLVMNNPEALAGIEKILRDCDIGAKTGKKLFDAYMRLEGERTIAEDATRKEAHSTYIADQIKEVEPYASKNDLDAWGATAASLLTEDFKNSAFNEDPEKNKAQALAIQRGLNDLNGSGYAVLAMNYLMKRVGGEQAIPPMAEGGGDGRGLDELRADLRKLQGSPEYQNGDDRAHAQAREWSGQIAKLRGRK